MKRPEKRRVFAMIGIVILVGMYVMTMIFALMKSPEAKALLMASIYCTIAVPVILYGIILITRNARNRKEPGEEPADDPEDGEKKDA
ncbi:MAG: hypothetical protein LKG53_04980 [Lachnospiraceae bacterium]|jgi:undecaprenyl pyrophosphate phosphatase UppP|nr:hypothetical protein [Lachnospiraceae bacterium]